MNINHNLAKSFFIPAVVSSVITLSMTPLVVIGGEYESGLTAYQKGEYTKAFQLIRISAEKGQAKGQFILSTMYRRGLGVEPDEYQSFTWCKRAAEQEMLEAQFQLGLMYLEGEGVTDDESEAVKWLWSAADRGYPQASEVLQYIFSDEHADEFNIGC